MKLPVTPLMLGAMNTHDIDPGQLVNAGLQFARMIEAGCGAELWRRSTPMIRNSIDAEMFGRSACSRHDQIGAIVSRRWTRLSRYSKDGGVGTPAGIYANVVFDLELKDGGSGQEMVTLRFDEDETWRLAGYGIK